MGKEVVKSDADIIMDQRSIQQKALNSWRHRKKPKDVKTLEQRIDEYFDFCIAADMTPSIETLALSLGTSRQWVVRWSRGERCAPEWAELIAHARQAVISAAEQRLYNGEGHPAAAIFTMKSLAGWKDNKSHDEDVEPLVAEDVMRASPAAMLKEYQSLVGIEQKDEPLESITFSEIIKETE